LTKTVKKQTQHDVRTYNTQLAQQIITETNGSKWAEKATRGCKSEGICAILREDGTIAKNHEEILQETAKFYSNLYKSTNKHGKHSQNQ